MVDYNATVITQQDNVTCGPRYPKELIEFLSGSED
jgi:hypothetical protein